MFLKEQNGICVSLLKSTAAAFVFLERILLWSRSSLTAVIRRAYLRSAIPSSVKSSSLLLTNKKRIQGGIRYMVIKVKVSDVAKDFGKSNKEIIDLLG